jgi:predicted DNA-binding transcriptional regulator AlpA
MNENMKDDTRPAVITAGEKPLGVKGAMELTGYCRSYIYKLIRLNQIPFHKPANGRFFFYEKEILGFVYRNRQAADYEAAEQADARPDGEA